MKTAFLIALVLSFGNLSTFSQGYSSQEISKIKYLIEIGQRQYKKKKINVEPIFQNESEFIDFMCNDTCTKEDIIYFGKIYNTLKYSNTKYETNLERGHLAIIVHQVEELLAKQYNINSNNIFSYPVICPCYNAMAIPLDKYNLKDTWLLEVNLGLGIDLGELGKISAKFIPLIFENDNVVFDFSNEGIVEHINNNPEILEEYLLRIIGHLFSQMTPDSTSIPISENYVSLYASFMTSMRIFTLAHEYSHAILKHNGSYLNSRFTKLKINNFNDIPEDLLKSNEYQADSFAFEIVYNNIISDSIEIQKTEIALIGPELFLTWLSVFEKAEEMIYGKGKIINNTHPSAIDRIDQLHKIINTKPIDHRNYYLIANSMNRILIGLLDVFESRILEIKDEIKKESQKSICFKKFK